MPNFYQPSQHKNHQRPNNPVQPTKTPVVGGAKNNKRVIITRKGTRVERK